MVKFMITGETTQSLSEIKNSIIEKQLNQIIDQFNTKFKELADSKTKTKIQLVKLKFLQFKKSFQYKNKFFPNPKPVEYNSLRHYH